MRRVKREHSLPNPTCADAGIIGIADYTIKIREI